LVPCGLEPSRSDLRNKDDSVKVREVNGAEKVFTFFCERTKEALADSPSWQLILIIERRRL